MQLAYVVACLTAVGSFLLNRILLKVMGPRVIITVSPVLEETLKTMLAYQALADILLTHFLFGCIEAIYDLVQTQGRGMAAAGLSIIGHALFGGITVAVGRLAGIYVGLAAGIIAHLLWNSVIVRLQAAR